MKDVVINANEESPYECFECGNIVVTMDTPVSCPDCGGDLRNRQTPLE